MGKKKAKPAEGEEEAGGGKKKMIMGVVGVLALGGVYNFVLKPKPAPTPEELAMIAEAEPVEGEIFELPEMVVNLNDPEVTYLKIGIALVLEEGTLAADFEPEAAIAKDVILADLTARTAAELRDPVGKQAVKDALSIEVREAYDDAKVVRVLFTGMVMQ